MITATRFFKGFSWAKFYRAKANEPLLADFYDAGLWDKKFKLHMVFYYDLIQCTSLSPETASANFTQFQKDPEPGLPPIFFGENELYLNPEDEAWLSPKFLKLLFKDLNQGLTYRRVFGDGNEPIGNEFVLPCLLTSSMTPATALAGAVVKFFGLSIFYLAIVRGHRDIPLSVAMRIEGQVPFLYHNTGGLSTGVHRVLWPKHERMSKALESMSKKVAKKRQPVIEAYYRLPMEIKNSNPDKVAKEIEKDLKLIIADPKKRPGIDSIKRYLKQEGIEICKGNL